MDAQKKKEKIKTLSSMLTVVGALIILVSLGEYFFTRNISLMSIGIGGINVLVGMLLRRQNK